MFNSTSIREINPTNPDVLKKEYCLPANKLVSLSLQYSGNFYRIQEGISKLIMFDSKGKEIPLELLKTGDVFWDVPGVQQWIKTLSITKLSCFSLKEIEIYQPQCEQVFGNLINNRYLRIIELIELNRKPTKQKIIHSLFKVIKWSSQSISSPIQLPSWTQKELESLTGLPLETVSRFLTELKNQGLIQGKRGKLEIPCVEKLKKFQD